MVSISLPCKNHQEISRITAYYRPANSKPRNDFMCRFCSLVSNTMIHDADKNEYEIYWRASIKQKRTSRTKLILAHKCLSKPLQRRFVARDVLLRAMMVYDGTLARQYKWTWEGGRRKVGTGRSVKDKFKSCLAVNSSCRKSFFHYSRRQSRGPHEDWDQIWYRLLGLLSEMWYQAWYQMWHRPLGAATRSVVQIWYWRYQIWLAPRKQASPT